MTPASETNPNRILEAARQIILDQGIEALSVRKLAAGSGLALKTIYNLYGSKPRVLVALFEKGTQAMDLALEQLRSAMVQRPWQTEFYLDWIAAVEPLFLNDPAVIKPAVIAGFSEPLPQAATALHQRRIQGLKSVFVTAAQKQLIHGDLDLDVLARLLYTSYFSVVVSWARGDLDDQDFIIHSRYAVLTVLHTMINAQDRRENALNLLRALNKEAK